MSTEATEAVEASLLSPQTVLIMHDLNTAPEKALPDGVMSFVNEGPRSTHMKGVNVT